MPDVELDWTLDTAAFNALCVARCKQRIEATQEATLRRKSPVADDARIFAAVEYNDDRQHHGASRAWLLGPGGLLGKRSARAETVATVEAIPLARSAVMTNPIPDRDVLRQPECAHGAVNKAKLPVRSVFITKGRSSAKACNSLTQGQLTMSLFKQSIPQLESKLSDLRTAHAKVMDDFALARAAIENIADRIQEGSDRTLFVESLASAQRDQVALRAQLEQLESAIATTKNALTAPVERPARKASAAQLNEASQAIEIAWRELVPALDKMTAALAASSYVPFMNATQDYQLVAAAMERAKAVANGGAVSNILQAAGTLANQISNGERPFALGLPAAEQQAAVRQAELEVNAKIREHHAAAAAGGKRVLVHN